MCGIVGLWRAGGLHDVDTHALSRMMALLRHRGPDGSDKHVDPSQGLAMGHTRLSIIDLSATGKQPIHDRAKGSVLTINGELYDYKTARAQLACAGERFNTKSDSELALKLYQIHGLDFVQHLRGEFALAIYDYERDRLVLVRDRFGVRPLFYHVTPNAVFYGSEAKTLLSHPDIPKRLDTHAALHQMMQTMVPGTSAFADISALQPGHMMVVTRDGDRLRVETKRYWDMDFPQAEEHDDNPNPDEYVEGVAEQLIDAVRVRLEADVPVGCYLSGGIDSCSILGLSTAMQQSPVKAFTISFDHDKYDEAAIATEMAMTTGADQELLQLTAAELYGDSFIRTAWHAERTFYNTLGVAKWHMSKRVRELGFKVVVTGEGADEMYAGYPFFKRDYFLHAPEVRNESEALLAKMNASNDVFKGAILSESAVTHEAMHDLCGFTPSWIQPWMLTLDAIRPLFAAPIQDELKAYDPIAAIAATLDPSKLRGRHVLDKTQYTWIKTMLEGQILNWGGDRVDMANSMESRPPFLDHLLAEHASRIPPQLRIRNGTEKWVLREAMKGVLPELLYKREKFAFMAPPGHTDAKKRSAMGQLAADYLNPERIETVALFDRSAVASFLERVMEPADAVQGCRDDIIFNHLVGLHILHDELIEKIS